MTKNEPVVTVYNTHLEAENVVKELQKAGFDMKKLSIIGRDYHTEENAVGYYNTGDRMKYWGKIGAFWGGFWGLLFGGAFFWVPGIGQVLAAGPVVAAIVGALEEAAVVGGLGVIGAGLYGMGIPKDSVIKYETALKASKFIVVAHGTPDEISRAKQIMLGVAHV
jgi:uncharacterized membrane protein